jgi:response regulator RpfG family c-di-GMP phosphodiesterase
LATPPHGAGFKGATSLLIPNASRESELIELGADDYIRKPVEPPLLVARVRAALRRAGA